MDIGPADTRDSLYLLAVEILSKYNINSKKISVIQSGGIKTVWKVDTGYDKLCLKRLKQSKDKALFSVNAQIYIKEKGGRVPGIILSEEGSPVVEYEDQLFVLYEWLEGRDLNFSDTADLCASIQGIAAFHLATKGYIPPIECKVSSKLAKWPDQYSSMRKRLQEWLDISLQKSNQSCYKAYLEDTPQVLEICEAAAALLENSPYNDLTRDDSTSSVLCHQDFGRGNALLTDNGVAVLDLDGVTFDLPARDLRKIIGKQCEIRGRWDRDLIEKSISWYCQVNPLSSDERSVIYIDLMYPHWYFGLVKNLFQKNKSVKGSEITKAAAFECSKVPLLNSLLKESIQ